MSYFNEIITNAESLDTLANMYLDKLPFLTVQETAERIEAASYKIFEAAGRDWDAVPWYVAQVVDGCMPFYGIPRNGSLRFALGFSVASQEAHLRNILELVEGRETKELEFPVMA